MIIEEFSFGNFKSFKDVQSLNMTAAKIKSKNPEIDTSNVISINDKLSLLKSKAIYGANASGKSNIVKALAVFIKIIDKSLKNNDLLSLVDSFKLSTETENEPTFFQIIFWINEVRYRYGFEANKVKIISEWLYCRELKEQPFFIREHGKITKIDKTNYSEGDKLISLFDGLNKDGSNDIFRENSLFLTSVASFGFANVSSSIVKSISMLNIISNSFGIVGKNSVAQNHLSKIKFKKFILEFLKLGDIGIERIEVLSIPKKDLPKDLLDENSESIQFLLSIKSKYNKQNKLEGKSVFDFEMNESEGTKKLFELSPFIYEAIKNGTPLIIDEFDARFHPLLTKKIVELFNSEKNKNAQLIFITHDTNLLSSDLLRKDQIDFVEKDKYGASHLYTLVQIKGIRNNASFEKDYIQGKYGAIPFLGNFEELFDFEIDAEEE